MKKEVTLDRQGIDQLSEELREWADKVGITKENRIRICLTMEELLLRIYEHYDEPVAGVLVIRKRFGATRFCLRYKAESYNPISRDEEGDAAAFPNLMARLGLEPEWSYRSGTNELSFRGPGHTIRKEVWLVAAILLSILSGLLRPVIPEAVKNSLIDYAFNPISNTFMNALNTFIGLMIIFTILSGICSIGSVSDFSRMGKRIIERMLGLTFLEVTLGFLLLLPFFRLETGNMAGGKSSVNEIVELLFSIVPSNPVTPFIDKNMLQIVFISLMTGAGLLVLERKTETLRKLVQEGMDLFMEVIGAVCKLLPLYIYTSLTVFMWKNGAGLFIRLWRPILLAFLVNLVIFLLKAVIVRIRVGVPMTTVIKKVLRNMGMGFATASSSAIFSQVMDVNEKDLGIAPDFNQFASPFALLFVVSQAGLFYVVTIFYLAEVYHTPTGVSWLIIMCIMCCIFSVTSPPVSGGLLVCLGMLMEQGNIPTEGMAIASILAIAIDFIVTGFKAGLTHLELVLEAASFDKLDREKLKS